MLKVNQDWLQMNYQYPIKVIKLLMLLSHTQHDFEVVKAYQTIVTDEQILDTFNWICKHYPEYVIEMIPHHPKIIGYINNPTKEMQRVQKLCWTL